MAATAPQTTSIHPDTYHDTHYHFHNPDEPKVGAHVIFVDGATFRDALVQVVFTEHGMPPLTIVLVKPGSRGDLQTKRLVPHQSKRVHGEACWCLPTEVLR